MSIKTGIWEDVKAFIYYQTMRKDPESVEEFQFITRDLAYGYGKLMERIEKFPINEGMSLDAVEENLNYLHSHLTSKVYPKDRATDLKSFRVNLSRLNFALLKVLKQQCYIRNITK